jgi:hypothetical protein
VIAILLFQKKFFHPHPAGTEAANSTDTDRNVNAVQA